MLKHLSIIFVFALCCGVASAQQTPTPRQSPTPPTTATTSAPAPPRIVKPIVRQAQPQQGFDLSAYGVRIQPEPRLIVMMAALEAAGFDPTPARTAPSTFRAELRRQQSGLDEGLRTRLRTFYERNKLPAPATAADQAARYLSLAYALGTAPGFDAPARTEDLPAGVLDVLDFAPLVREFYRQSGIAERLPLYVKAAQDEGDKLRPRATELVRGVLTYLHTRPITTTIERVPVKNTDAKKKNEPQRYTVREHERRFFIVPDILAVPGAINFRVIADDYYVVLPPDANPNSVEVRRAYLQYVLDPLVIRFSKEIAARREPLKALLDERTSAGNVVTPDIFLAVSRSLAAAADVRLDQTSRLNELSTQTQARLSQTQDAATRARITKEMQAAHAALDDEATAQLAAAYERGGVLAFYFAEQLRGIEASGFDVANFLADMIASFDPLRESRRPAEYAAPRERAIVARLARQAERASSNSANANEEENSPEAAHRAALVNSLSEVEAMLKAREFAEAETRLKALMQEYQGEPRIFYALGQTAYLLGRQTTDDALQSQRLNQALSHFRNAVSLASVDTDRALLSRAHETMGRILAALDQPAEALKEFEAAIGIGKVEGGAYQEALADKEKLTKP